MRPQIYIFILLMLASCVQTLKPKQLPVVGTWELISATSTEKDKTISTFNPKVKMIKIINPTHFAFLSSQSNNIWQVDVLIKKYQR